MSESVHVSPCPFVRICAYVPIVICLNLYLCPPVLMSESVHVSPMSGCLSPSECPDLCSLHKNVRICVHDPYHQFSPSFGICCGLIGRRFLKRFQEIPFKNQKKEKNFHLKISLRMSHVRPYVPCPSVCPSIYPIFALFSVKRLRDDFFERVAEDQDKTSR